MSRAPATGDTDYFVLRTPYSGLDNNTPTSSNFLNHPSLDSSEPLLFAQRIALSPASHTPCFRGTPHIVAPHIDCSLRITKTHPRTKSHHQDQRVPCEMYRDLSRHRRTRRSVSPRSRSRSRTTSRSPVSEGSVGGRNEQRSASRSRSRTRIRGRSYSRSQSPPSQRSSKV